MRPSSSSRHAGVQARSRPWLGVVMGVALALTAPAAANTNCSCRNVAALGTPGGCTVFETDILCELDYSDLTMDERREIAEAVERAGEAGGRAIPTTESLDMEPLMERLGLPFPPRAQWQFMELFGYGVGGRYQEFAGLATEILAQGFYRYFVDDPAQAGDSRAFQEFTVDLFDWLDLRRHEVLDAFLAPVDRPATASEMTMGEFATDQGVFDVVVSPGCISVGGSAFFTQFKTVDSPLEFFCDGGRPQWLEVQPLRGYQ